MCEACLIRCSEEIPAFFGAKCILTTNLLIGWKQDIGYHKGNCQRVVFWAKYWQRYDVDMLLKDENFAQGIPADVREFLVSKLPMCVLKPVVLVFSSQRQRRITDNGRNK